MSTEPEKTASGQPETSPQPTNVMVAPEQVKAPEQPAQEASAPKYDGASVEDLIRQMKEKDDYIASVNERAARAEHEAVLTRNLVEQFARDRNAKKDEELPEITDEEYVAAPGKTLTKAIRYELGRFKADLDREKTEQNMYQARTAFEQGRENAIKANPALFRGIETDLTNQLNQTIASGLRAGQMIDTETLKGSDYWTTAAITYRLAKGEKPLEVLKYFANTSPAPMTPVHTETPSPGGPSKAVPAMSDEDRAGARFFGVTEEQWIAAKGKK